jgi:hypothetical protein
MQQMTSHQLVHRQRAQRHVGDARQMRATLAVDQRGDVETERRAAAAKVGSDRLAHAVQTDDGVERSHETARCHGQRLAIAREEELASLDDDAASNNVAAPKRAAVRITTTSVDVTTSIIAVNAVRTTLDARKAIEREIRPSNADSNRAR